MRCLEFDDDIVSFRFLLDRIGKLSQSPYIRLSSDFAFGLDWSGVIKDGRVARYR